jgi:DNA-binding NarL/FixJ family response regulator
MDSNTVLSLSPSKEALVLRHTALRKAGMKVISVLTPLEARFEIEMGRCGNLLMCYRLSAKAADDLARLFRQYCSQGRIVFITDHSEDKIPSDADAHIPESSGPEGLIEAVRPAAHI